MTPELNAQLMAVLDKIENKGINLNLLVDDLIELCKVSHDKGFDSGYEFAQNALGGTIIH